VSDVVAFDQPLQSRGGIYYGWANMVVAAAAMVATLPGRTFGLGMITEPLLRDLNVSHFDFAAYNAWATLIGSSFCLACGPLIDRWGVRAVLTGVVVALAATVLGMSRVSGSHGLLVSLVLTRGFGQSALSVVSLTIVGKWFVRRLPVAMGIYSVLSSVGFIIAVMLMGYALGQIGWREIWFAIGCSLCAFAVLGWLIVRASPESIGVAVDGDLASKQTGEAVPEDGFTLGQALRTSAFWAFALSASIYGLIATGLLLFNEAVLREHGFPQHVAVSVIAIVTLLGLLANFLGGWLADRWPIGRLMGMAMLFLAASLCMLPAAYGPFLVYGYAVTMGLSGGIVTVIFFVCWGRVFGRRHLGAIQGAAQLLTVFGSAGGPLALQFSVRLTGSSSALMLALAPVVVGLGVWSMLLRLPKWTPDSLASSQPPRLA
jgi:MFS family permease